MKSLFFISVFSMFLIGCVPEEKVTDFGLTVNPLKSGDVEYVTREDQPLLIQYEAKSGEESVDLKLKMVEKPKHGVLEACIDSSQDKFICTYVPDENFNGEDSIKFVTQDGDFQSDGYGTLKIIVTPVADKPVAPSENLSEVLPENHTHNFKVLPGSDIDSKDLSYIVVDAPVSGELINCFDGLNNLECSYKPNQDFYGEDAFTYKVVDPDGAESELVTAVKIKVLNYPELGADISVDVPQAGVAKSFEVNPISDDDSDMNQIQLQVIKSPSNGKLGKCFASAGSLSCEYTANASFSGVDELEYIASDKDGLQSSAGKVIFNVALKMPPIVGEGQLIEVMQGKAITFQVNEGSDPDSDVNKLRYVVTNPPSKGILSDCFPSLEDSLKNRTCTYTPSVGSYGVEDSFSYKIVDDYGKSSLNTAKVTIDIGAGIVPSAKNHSIDVYKNDQKTFEVPLADDSDSDAAALKYEVVSAPSKGDLINCFAEKGLRTCTYKSNINEPSSDEFTYKVTDELGLISSIATVSINVINPPTLPNYDDVNDIIAKCNEARELQQTKRKVYSVDFPGSTDRYTCDFNDDAVDPNDASDLNLAMNGPRKNERIRARLEQDVNIQLPEDAIICDMDFNFPEAQQIKYDDEIFLTVNNYVVMGSQDLSTGNGRSDFINGLLLNAIGLVEYKWLGQNGMYDLPYVGNNGLSRYCLGVNASDPNFSQKCQIPPTDRVGTFKLDIPSEEIVKLGIMNNSGKIDSNSNIKFSWISIGDNDNGDCETSPYGLDVDVEYVQLESSEVSEPEIATTE